MASSAVVLSLIKALSDKKFWKGIGIVIGTLCVPIILIVMAVFTIQSAFAEHNNEAVDAVFNNKSAGIFTPNEYKKHIKEMQKAFKKLDNEISEYEDDDSLDSIRIKAIFYALFFEKESLFEIEIKDDGEEIEIDKVDFEDFVKCFSSAEKLSEIYTEIEDELDIEISYEDKANASEIYYRVLYGKIIPDYGEEFDVWLNSITSEEVDYRSERKFGAPIINWEEKVTSEYGKRLDPISKKESVHTGIDFGAIKGTEIYATKSGIVKFARYKTTGYGYHTVIEHGDGEVSLYAHCSEILVTEGDEVEKGQLIARVGSTGKSTGNHLHFEIRIDGKTKNPRLYLEEGDKDNE